MNKHIRRVIEDLRTLADNLDNTYGGNLGAIKDAIDELRSIACTLERAKEGESDDDT